jgi:hypothetical protein
MECLGTFTFTSILSLGARDRNFHDVFCSLLMRWCRRARLQEDFSYQAVSL